MKKITTLFFLFVIICLLNKRDIVRPAALVNENYIDHFFCYISFDKWEMNTHLFLEKFLKEEIIEIEPFPYLLSKNKLNPYIFTAESNEENIKRLEKKYSEDLYNKGMTKEANIIYLSGVPIESTKIVCTSKTYQKMKKVYQNVIKREK